MSRIKQLTLAGFICMLVSAFALPGFAGPGTGTDCCQLTITTCPSDDAVLQADASCSVIVPDYREQIGYNAFSCGSVTVSQSPEPGTTVSTCGSLTIEFTISACVICDPETQTECIPFTDTCQLVLQVAPPAVTCPEGGLQATVEADQTCTAEVPDLTSQVNIPGCLSDGCNLLVQQTPAAGTSVGLEGTDVTVVVRLCQGDQTPDECQILATCSGHVTVVQPGITCPESQEFSIQVEQDCKGIVPDLTGDVGVPDCLNTETCQTVVTQSPEAGASVGIGFTTVTVTVQQCCTVPEQAPQCTTLSTCQFFINFTPPALTCPEPQTLMADTNCQAIVPDLTGEIGVPECLLTEKEGLLELRKTQSPEAGTVIGVGETQVTVHVELCHTQQNPPAIVQGVECLQVGDCVVTLTVEDQTAPVIVNCPGDVTILADTDCLGQIPDLTVPSVLAVVEATDNCSSQANIVLTQDPPAGTQIDVADGNTTLTVTATDEAGNSSDCSVTVILDSNGCQSPGPDPIPDPDDDGPGPQPAPCDPDAESLNLLFSMLFHAPVCGSGCPLMVMVTICAIVAFKVGSRRSRRR